MHPGGSKFQNSVWELWLIRLYHTGPKGISQAPVGSWRWCYGVIFEPEEMIRNVRSTTTKPMPLLSQDWASSDTKRIRKFIHTYKCPKCLANGFRRITNFRIPDCFCKVGSDQLVLSCYGATCGCRHHWTIVWKCSTHATPTANWCRKESKGRPELEDAESSEHHWRKPQAPRWILKFV